MDAAVARIRAWVSMEGQVNAALAKAADVDEKTIRQAAALGEPWNPTVATLRKIAEIVPKDWQPAPKRRRAA